MSLFSNLEDAGAKISKEALEASLDNTAKKLAGLTGNAGGLLAIAAGVIGVAGLADHAMKRQDRIRMEQQENAQSDREQTKEAGYAQYKTDAYQSILDMGSIPLDAYNNRTGHSNTWGGKKY